MSDRIVTDEEIQQMLAISGYIEGAWFVSRDVVCAPGNDNDLWMVAEICGSCGHPQDTSDANATLIAAAPDLQAALRQTLARALAAEAKVERLRAALADLVDCNERWNDAVLRIIHRPPNWTDNYLNAARATLKDTCHD